MKENNIHYLVKFDDASTNIVKDNDAKRFILDDFKKINNRIILNFDNYNYNI